jgi:hypothetical protein
VAAAAARLVSDEGTVCSVHPRQAALARDPPASSPVAFCLAAGARRPEPARGPPPLRVGRRLALNPSDDAAFLRVVNTPPRRLGDACIARLREAQDEAVAAAEERGGAAGPGPVGAAAAGRPHAGVSLLEVTRQLLRAPGALAAIHANGLRRFLDVVTALSDDVMGLAPDEAVLRVLQLSRLPL